MKTFKMTAIYTAPTFPRGAILCEERAGRAVRYFWEMRDGSKQECSAAFVKARRKYWARRPV